MFLGVPWEVWAVGGVLAALAIAWDGKPGIRGSVAVASDRTVVWLLLGSWSLRAVFWAAENVTRAAVVEWAQTFLALGVIVALGALLHATGKAVYELWARRKTA